ncbi:MAG: FAD-dependent monooxygenase [Massilia sp.]
MNQYETGGSAVIVGASLSGLMTALTLARAGLDVVLLERSADTGRTGAALHVDSGLLQQLTMDPAALKHDVPSGVQTWFTVHAHLHAAVAAVPQVRLCLGTWVKAVGQNSDGAWVITSDGQRLSGDIVVGADGHRSIVRRSVWIEKPDADFAGYVIWLGLAQESALAPVKSWPQDLAILDRKDWLLLGYPLPGRNGGATPGDRQLGWAWYDASRNGLLRERGCVSGNVVHHSLRPGDIPERTYDELEQQARTLWPSPWRQAVLDCVDRRTIIGTPISEYLPDRLVDGRIALVGDAAHVPTPMTGKGFSASLHDALALGAAVRGGIRGHAAPHALQKYEAARLDAARNLVLNGQKFSRSFGMRAIAESAPLTATY